MSRLRLFIATLIATSFVSVSGLLVAAPVQAQLFQGACQSGEASQSTVCQDDDSSQSTGDNKLYGPNGIITKIANIIAIVAGIAAVFIIIIAGIQYMTSTGDPTKVNNAKNAILYTIIGLLVIVIARSLVVFVVSKL